jgi:hypothetical protein
MTCLVHNVTTPVLPEVLRANSSFFIHPSSFSVEWGNPLSAYEFGSSFCVWLRVKSH